MAIIYLKDAIPVSFKVKEPEKNKTRIIHLPKLSAVEAVKLLQKDWNVLSVSMEKLVGVMKHNILAVYDEDDAPIEEEVVT